MYSVHHISGFKIRDLTRRAANGRARNLSRENAYRYWFYEVRDSDDDVTAVWVRGAECSLEQYPRVEVRDNTDQYAVAVIPVVDDDTTWSLSAGSVVSQYVRYTSAVLVASAGAGQEAAQ